MRILRALFFLSLLSLSVLSFSSCEKNGTPSNLKGFWGAGFQDSSSFYGDGDGDTGYFGYTAIIEFKDNGIALYYENIASAKIYNKLPKSNSFSDSNTFYIGADLWYYSTLTNTTYSASEGTITLGSSMTLMIDGETLYMKGSSLAFTRIK